MGAHAVLLRSNPAQNAHLQSPPPLVQLFFSEPLDRRFSSLQVRSADGAVSAAPSPGFTPDPTELDIALAPLPPGIFSVVWTSVSSVDGHRLQGSFPFIVLNADGSVPLGPAVTTTTSVEAGFAPVDAVVRFLIDAGLAIITGAFACVLLVMLPAARTGEEAERAGAERQTRRLLGALCAPVAGLATGAVVLRILRQTLSIGNPADIGRVLSGRTGQSNSALACMLALVCIICVQLHRGSARHVLGANRRLWVGLVACMIGLATQALISHGAARSGAVWAVPAYFIHLVSASLWLGGLVMLPLLGVFLQPVEGRARLPLLGEIYSRFSSIAAGSVAALVLTGLFNASVEVGAPGNLRATSYGRTLVLKVLLVGLLLAIALINAVVLAPRFRRVAALSRANAAPLLRQLGWTVALEAALGGLVLAAAATLALNVPARDAVAGERARLQPGATATSIYRNTSTAGDLQVTLTVLPNRPGENGFRIVLNGIDVDRVSRVQLRFQLPGRDAGASAVPAESQGGGLFMVSAANLTDPGRWQINVGVRRDGHDDVAAVFTVEVPDPAGVSTLLAGSKRDLWAFPAKGISANQASGVVLVFFAVVIYRSHRWWRARGLLPGRAATTLTAVTATGGAILFFAVHSHGAAGTGVLSNPVPGDERSLRSGGRLFAENCASCHGATGHGDGPLAAGLNPHPVDLTVHAGLHSDAQLYDWISAGIRGTAMPAWQAQLSDQERWDLVNYLRTLSADFGRDPDGRPVDNGPAWAQAALGRTDPTR